MKALQAIETYQVPGAVGNFDPINYNGQIGACGWDDHVAGTRYTGVGKFFLGMPRGFNRVGIYEDMKLLIFGSYEQYNEYFDKKTYNVPAWKHLDEHKNTLVRGLMPRRNEPFLCVIIGNCIKQIDCLEISKKEIEEMD